MRVRNYDDKKQVESKKGREKKQDESKKGR